MTVTLHLDPGSAGSTPLTEAPTRYAFNRTMGYAHMPRSARVQSDGWTLVDLLCGLSVRIAGPDGQVPPGRTIGMWSDDPAGRPVCGTCYGRSHGLDPAQPDVAFRPYKSLSGFANRVWCPGHRQNLWIPRPDDHRYAVCVLCGQEDKVTTQGGSPYYSGTPCIRAHRLNGVAEALVFCPVDGWSRLQMRRPQRLHDLPVVQCTGWRCEFAVQVELTP